MDLRELNFTRNKPNIEDLIGTWTPDKTSMEDISNRGHYANAKPTITLRTDGTFSIREMPDWWSDGFGRSHGSVVALDGKWMLEQREEVWRIWTLRLRTSELLTWIHLYRQRPPYALFIGIGDPNDANAMLFERLKQP